MSPNNDWYESIEREISSLKEKMTKGDYKLFEVDLLLRAAKRVTSFSSGCEYCQGHRNDISNLVADLGNLPKMTEEEVADYGRKFRSILRHLDKHHGLHRSVPNPGIPLGIGGLILLIVVIMLPIGILATSFGTFDIIGIVYIGLFITSIIFLIVGVVLGIIRLFTKPI